MQHQQQHAHSSPLKAKAKKTTKKTRPGEEYALALENVHSVRFSIDVVRHDIEAILWSMELYQIRRFYKQRFWEEESLLSDAALSREQSPRLESVAEHSWHVADTVILLGDHFPWIRKERSLELAVLHDKLELITGDADPIGADGSGRATHAFSGIAQQKKVSGERAALKLFLSKTRTSLREKYRQLFDEYITGRSEETRFVRAIDKMQPLVYIYHKKRGLLEDRHLAFTLRYSRQCIEYFPPLKAHYEYLSNLLLKQVASNRDLPIRTVEKIAGEAQMELFG